MKKVLFIMVLCLLMLGMKAQTTGLYDLRFGDSYSNCEGNLFCGGLNYYLQTDEGGVIFRPDSSRYFSTKIDHVTLYFDNGNEHLTGWVVFYPLSDHYDVEERITVLLKDLHGDYVYHLVGKFYSWKFDDTHGLEAGFNDDGDLFYAEYGTIIKD